jgi:urease gamma subunit
MAALCAKRKKLLDLHYQERISAEAFGEEEARLTRQIEALRSEEFELEAEHARQDELSQRFDEVAELLRQIDVEAVWAAGTEAERRVLVGIRQAI